MTIVREAYRIELVLNGLEVSGAKIISDMSGLFDAFGLFIEGGVGVVLEWNFASRVIVEEGFKVFVGDVFQYCWETLDESQSGVGIKGEWLIRIGSWVDVGFELFS